MAGEDSLRRVGAAVLFHAVVALAATQLTPAQKAALLVVSELPAPPEAGGVIARGPSVRSSSPTRRAGASAACPTCRRPERPRPTSRSARPSKPAAGPAPRF